MSLDNEYVVLVDESDNQIGLEEKIAAHKKALLHRAFSVFLYRYKNNNLEILLQQRADHKYHCPMLWTNSCCSHPRDKEDVVSAGKRRLLEELGYEQDIKKVGSFIYKAIFDNGLTEYEFDHVLAGCYKHDSFDASDSKYLCNYNKDEVNSLKWIDVTTLQLDIEKNSKNYTPWLPLALEVFLVSVPLKKSELNEISNLENEHEFA